MRVAAFLFVAIFAGVAPLRAGNEFVVIGDTPYSSDDEEMLNSAVAEVKRRNPPFVIHLGDFKGGRAPCDGAAEDAFARLIEALEPIPVFATPGDNDWTDCDRSNDQATGKPYSELGRLAALRARFHAGPASGSAALNAERQSGQPENQTWTHAGVRFATVHAVGSEDGLSYVNGDAPELAAAETFKRQKANADWIARAAKLAKKDRAKALVLALQADFTDVKKSNVGKACAGASEKLNPCDAFIGLRAGFRSAAAEFAGPVLVIHGDTEPFTLNQNFLDGGAANLWRLNAAGDAGLGATGFGYGVRDVTLVTLTGESARPFAARGLVTDRIPKAKE